MKRLTLRPRFSSQFQRPSSRPTPYFHRMRLTVRAELGGNYEETFADISKHLLDLFTFKACRTVLNQLHETDPSRYKWLYNFSLEHPPHRQEDYIKALLAADREMGGRVLETRVALYERWQSKASMGAVLEDMKGANLKQLRGNLLSTASLDNLTEHPLIPWVDKSKE